MIQFEDVSLGTEARLVLDQATGTFAPGQVTALVDVPSRAAPVVLDAILGLRGLNRGRISVGLYNPAFDGLAVRHRTSLVPATAPVHLRASPAEFVRFVGRVAGGRVVSRADVVRALRLAELPDSLFDSPGARLTEVERLSVWLAIHAVRQTSVLLIDDPFSALTPAQASNSVRLIREACAPDQVVVVTGRRRDLPSGSADRFLSLQTRDLRALTPSASTVTFTQDVDAAQR